jgi:formylglycine-generating enzyme required for sulfatase activity
VFQVGKLEVPTTPTPSATQPTNEAAQAWALTQGTTSQAVLEDFIKRYGDTFYGTLARGRLEDLKKSQVAAAAPPVTPTSPVVSSGPCGGAPVTVSLSSRSAKPLSAAEECSLKPKDVFKECDKCPEMVVVPPGSFTMGSPLTEEGHSKTEEPQHSVNISKLFAVGKFHITVDQFADFVKETGHDAGSTCAILEENNWKEQSGSFLNPGFPQSDSHPAVCLTQDDGKEYVAWLSKRTGRPYRLLSEAEWEYAARARTEPGSNTRYFFGDNQDDMCRYGNVADQTTKRALVWVKDQDVFKCSDGYAYTAPVGSFMPNTFGLYDMHGNASTLLEDCWHENYYGAPTDGSAWAPKDNSTWTKLCVGWMVRGAGWIAPPIDHLTTRGGRFGPRDYLTGLRVARTLTP